MDTIMSACGVQCSECGAYRAASKGLPYQQEVADAWRRIYGRDEATTSISCGGCLGRSPSNRCYALSRGFRSICAAVLRAQTTARMETAKSMK